MAHHSKVWPVAPTDGVDSLTAAEAAALDNGQYSAIDGDAGGTWAPAAVVEIGGAGLQRDKALDYVRSVNANYTLDASGPDVIILADTGAAGIAIQLTAAVANRVVKIKHYAGAANLLIKPNGTDTIEGLNANYSLTQIGSEVALVGVSGGWTIVGRGRNQASLVFTATTLSGFTVPAGCYFVDYDMCGGGASGGGGAPGSNGASVRAGGGSGGGGAPRQAGRIAVTPGQVLDFNVGAGGASAAANADGNDGGPSWIAVHGGATLASAAGGGHGTKGGPVGAGLTLVPGGTVNGAGNTGTLTTFKTFQDVGVASQGGAGSNYVNSVPAETGSTSASGQLGGSGGNTGADSGTSFCGGGGGGGGGGAYGAGGNGGAAGNGNASGAGGNGGAGASATANTGGGGGGGGGAGCGTSGGTGGASGAGGSGKISIFWIE